MADDALRHMVRLFAFVLLGVSVVFGIGTAAPSAAPQQTPKAVKGELIVGFTEGVSRGEQNAILKDAGATSKKRFGQIDAVLVKVKDDEEAFVIKALSSEPQVAYAEPNHVVSIAVTPNDPSFSQLWGLHNTGQTGGTNDRDIDAPEAWSLATGDSSIVVAVTDTGVDFTHPDLANQRWVNSLDDPGDNFDDDGNGLVDDWSGWDFVNDDNDPFDDNNHGTHVSGTIGAEGNNGIGVVGVNWNVKIMALKFLSSAGSGSTADAIGATLYAADHGADVASNSWGGGPYDQALLNAIEYGASRGMLFVAAAGNDSQNNDVTPTYPATYDSDAVLAVAATDHSDAMAFFSSYGANTVDLGAPGVNILSTTPGNTYQSFSGTSMATPHVAGAAALVEDAFPGATLYGIKALLMNSVDPAPALAGKTVTGGRLNIGTALSCGNEPKVVLGAPANGFVVGVGDVIPIRVLGANCAVPAGIANVTATVNGATVDLSASNPDSGLYTGSYTVTAPGALAFVATVTIGGSTDTQTATGNAFLNYTCQDAPFSWVDVTGVSPLVGADGDDNFSTLAIGFPIAFFGQTYSTAYISSNGFLTLGSNLGANAPLNAAIPTTAAPNGVIAPFWDDLYPGASVSVHAAVSGVAPNRTLYVEWFNVPHFNISSSGPVTFEAIIKENGDIRYQYLDTSFDPAGNPAWNAGGSATAGVERPDGVVGRQISFNQPLLTNGKAVSCTYGAPPPPPVPTITTTSLEDGTTGQSYSQTLQAGGGTPPHTWSIASGSLPPGLGLNASTGAITGTPTTTGTSSFTARVTDSFSQTATKPLQIAVADPLAITTTSLPGGTVGQPYSQTMGATGGKTAYSWSISSGTLQAGLSLNSATGAVTGTPTASGTSNVTVRVTDAGTPTRADTQDLSLTIASPPQPTITTSSLQDGTTGQSYSQTFEASGGTPPYAWSLDSGSPPPGLSLSAGEITGTPSTVGDYPFTIRVTDNLAQTSTRALAIAVADPLLITTTSMPAATAGQAYSQQTTATGGKADYSWSLVGGSLPPGLSLNSGNPSAAISGTPTTPGNYAFTVQVADSGNPTRTDSRALSIVVSTQPTVTTVVLKDGTTTEPYNDLLDAAGGTPPYTWTLESGSLPAGLGLSGAGNISGAPTAAGTSTLTVRVTDSVSGTNTRTLQIAVANPLAITTTSLPGGTVGQLYSQTVGATGGKTAYSWGIASGTLPAGLSLNNATGAVTGTPTASGTSNFTVRVTDAGNPTRADTQVLSITIASAAPLTIASWNLPEGKVGVAYPGAVTASGGVGTYTWSRASGTLPTGLSIVQGTPTMRFSGLPTKNAVFSFTLRVTDSLGATTTRAFSIKIRK